MEGDRNQLRAMVRGAYDEQKLRIQMGNRIVGNFKVRLGQEPGKPEEELDAESLDVLTDLRKRFERISDGVPFVPKKKFKADGVIATYTDYCLVGQYFECEKMEASHFRRLVKILDDFPIWTDFLLGVRGIGPAMGGVIISEIDIHRAKYPSSLWKYCGLAVEHDGRGQSKRKEHLVDREYKAADGTMKTRKSITFNPWLKTKLVGVLASSFLRAGDSKYRDVYDDYKHRLESHKVYGIENESALVDGKKVTSKLRRHNMAMRYMIKIFLVDLHVEWRGLEGLPVTTPYCEAKLGMRHTG